MFDSNVLRVAIDRVGSPDYPGLLAAAVADDDSDPLRYGAAHVDEIAACERAIRILQARQTHLVDQLLDDRTALAKTKDIHVSDHHTMARSVVAEVALARGVSATAAQSQLAVAGGLSRLPGVADLFAAGLIAERVVRTVVAETTNLAPEHVRLLEDKLVPELPTMTAKQAGHLTAKIVTLLDSHVAAHVTRRARDDRFMTLTPQAHAMAQLSIRMGAEQAAAIYHCLDDRAHHLQKTGDERTVGQLMVDEAIERLTGHKIGQIPVEINLHMTPGSLLGDDDIPALLNGHGPLPATIARQLSTESQTFVRRLFTDPIDDTVLTRDPRRRRYDGPLARLIKTRDNNRCTRPWCDCAIRDIDHRAPYNGSNTTIDNAQGLCKRSHTTKHLSGFNVEHTPETGESTWVTPTGHRYTSRPQRPFANLPTTPPPLPGPSWAELKLRNMITAHRQAQHRNRPLKT